MKRTVLRKIGHRHNVRLIIKDGYCYNKGMRPWALNN